MDFSNIRHYTSFEDNEANLRTMKTIQSLDQMYKTYIPPTMPKSVKTSPPSILKNQNTSQNSNPSLAQVVSSTTLQNNLRDQPHDELLNKPENANNRIASGQIIKRGGNTSSFDSSENTNGAPLRCLRRTNNVTFAETEIYHGYGSFTSQNRSYSNPSYCVYPTCCDCCDFSDEYEHEQKCEQPFEKPYKQPYEQTYEQPYEQSYEHPDGHLYEQSYDQSCEKSYGQPYEQQNPSDHGIGCCCFEQTSDTSGTFATSATLATSASEAQEDSGSVSPELPLYCCCAQKNLVNDVGLEATSQEEMKNIRSNESLCGGAESPKVCQCFTPIATNCCDYSSAPCACSQDSTSELSGTSNEETSTESRFHSDPTQYSFSSSSHRATTSNCSSRPSCDSKTRKVRKASDSFSKNSSRGSLKTTGFKFPDCCCLEKNDSDRGFIMPKPEDCKVCTKTGNDCCGCDACSYRKIQSFPKRATWDSSYGYKTNQCDIRSPELPIVLPGPSINCGGSGACSYPKISTCPEGVTWESYGYNGNPCNSLMMPQPEVSNVFPGPSINCGACSYQKMPPSQSRVTWNDAKQHNDAMYSCFLDGPIQTQTVYNRDYKAHTGVGNQHHQLYGGCCWKDLPLGGGFGQCTFSQCSSDSNPIQVDANPYRPPSCTLGKSCSPIPDKDSNCCPLKLTGGGATPGVCQIDGCCPMNAPCYSPMGWAQAPCGL
nr:uncharacterized protein LOC108070514 [Drosophila kikkawai]XP_041632037.1 uncharacterized protein LOC108070514 [Drosophila kikkawai]